MIGGRKDCRAGKRCHPPPRPNEKTNGEAHGSSSPFGGMCFISAKTRRQAQKHLRFLPSFVFLIKSYYFGSADEHYCFMYFTHSFSSSRHTRYSAPFSSKNFFRSRLSAFISSTAFMAWSEAQIFPRTVAHISLKKRREVLRYLSLSKYAHRFGRISCSAFFMARYSSMSASISLSDKQCFP